MAGQSLYFIIRLMVFLVPDLSLLSMLGPALLLFAQEAAQKPLLFRLDDARRAKVLAALAGLVILGFLMVTLAWLGGRVTRRYMGVGVKPKPSTLPGDEEWARPAADAADVEPPRKGKG